MIVSSEDYSIRVFKGDQVIAEHVETEIVTGLVALPESRFAYSVSNGTVGVYEQDVRLWRVKVSLFAPYAQSVFQILDYVERCTLLGTYILVLQHVSQVQFNSVLYSIRCIT